MYYYLMAKKSEMGFLYVNGVPQEEYVKEIIGWYEKIRDQWPAFVAHKTSEKSKKMPATNKINATKKKHHHRTGSGG